MKYFTALLIWFSFIFVCARARRVYPKSVLYLVDKNKLKWGESAWASKFERKREWKWNFCNPNKTTCSMHIIPFFLPFCLLLLLFVLYRLFFCDLGWFIISLNVPLLASIILEFECVPDMSVNWNKEKTKLFLGNRYKTLRSVDKNVNSILMCWWVFVRVWLENEIPGVFTIFI